MAGRNEAGSPAEKSRGQSYYFWLYRYWDDAAYNATTHPGYENQIKYIYDAEGLRRYDLSVDLLLDEDFLTASEATLESYASAYFEYNSDRTIREAWFNGECGCSGAGDGTFEFTYDPGADVDYVGV